MKSIRELYRIGTGPVVTQWDRARLLKYFWKNILKQKPFK